MIEKNNLTSHINWHIHYLFALWVKGSDPREKGPDLKVTFRNKLAKLSCVLYFLVQIAYEIDIFNILLNISLKNKRLHKSIMDSNLNMYVLKNIFF